MPRASIGVHTRWRGSRFYAPAIGGGTMTAVAEAPVETPVLDADAEYPPHPQAVLFPQLSAEQYAALRESIARHGQQQPIEVQAGTTFLLDGRHRLRAC